MHENRKRIPIPDPGDDILTSLETAFNAAGIIVPYDSVSAFRTALASAEAGGFAPTAAHPWYGDIAGIIYRATGTKNQTTGAYIISPVNETQWTSNVGGTVSPGDHTIAAGMALKVTGTTLPVANYDRMVLGIGNLWASVKAGNVDLELRMNGTRFRSRIPNVDDGNITASGAILLPAGVKPDFEVCAVAAGSGGNAVVTLVSDEWTRITVMAWPVSMA